MSQDSSFLTVPTSVPASLVLPIQAKTLNLMLLDEHSLIREGIKLLLEQGHWPGFEKVEIQTVASESELKQVLLHFCPDLALLRYQPEASAKSEWLSHLRAEYPGLRVVLYHYLPDGQYRTEYLLCGAQGFLARDLSPEQLIPALLSVYYGGYYCGAPCRAMPPAAADSEALASLSLREREVLSLIAADCSREEIARRLNISIRTVDTYRGRLLKKLKLHSSIGLARFALENGLT